MKLNKLVFPLFIVFLILAGFFFSEQRNDTQYATNAITTSSSNSDYAGQTIYGKVTSINDDEIQVTLLDTSSLSLTNTTISLSISSDTEITDQSQSTNSQQPSTQSPFSNDNSSNDPFSGNDSQNVPSQKEDSSQESNSSSDSTVSLSVTTTSSAQLETDDYVAIHFDKTGSAEAIAIFDISSIR